jgi:hypothetical protein
MPFAGIVKLTVRAAEQGIGWDAQVMLRPLYHDKWDARA